MGRTIPSSIQGGSPRNIGVSGAPSSISNGAIIRSRKCCSWWKDSMCSDRLSRGDCNEMKITNRPVKKDARCQRLIGWLGRVQLLRPFRYT